MSIGFSLTHRGGLGLEESTQLTALVLACAEERSEAEGSYCVGERIWRDHGSGHHQADHQPVQSAFS